MIHQASNAVTFCLFQRLWVKRHGMSSLSRTELAKPRHRNIHIGSARTVLTISSDIGSFQAFIPPLVVHSPGHSLEISQNYSCPFLSRFNLSFNAYSIAQAQLTEGVNVNSCGKWLSGVTHLMCFVLSFHCVDCC